MFFWCVDKNGTTIVCSKETWNNHVLAEHPEMEGCEAYVKAVIEKPYQIYQDGRHPNIQNIYRPFILPKPYNLYYLRVAIKYRKKVLGDLKGYISTAFPCVNIRKGDILIWEES